jgi:catechol 2,3-dioxygenase-like lactoylglutathione lyase family enzyme
VTIWAIHRVSLSTHDLAKAQEFFEARFGLGRAVKVDDQTLAFGSGSRGLRIKKPPRLLTRAASEILGSVGARHVAFEINDINRISSKLDRATIPYAEALPGDFDTPAIYTVDPAMNVVAFCQRPKDVPTDQGIQSWEDGWGWGIHHDRRPLASSGCRRRRQPRSFASCALILWRLQSRHTHRSGRPELRKPLRLSAQPDDRRTPGILSARCARREGPPRNGRQSCIRRQSVCDGQDVSDLFPGSLGEHDRGEPVCLSGAGSCTDAYARAHHRRVCKVLEAAGAGLVGDCPPSGKLTADVSSGRTTGGVQP